MNNPTVSRPPRLKQDFSRLDLEIPLDLSKIKWVYLSHPSGRIHRINADYKSVIENLLRWGWKKVKTNHR